MAVRASPVTSDVAAGLNPIFPVIWEVPEFETAVFARIT